MLVQTYIEYTEIGKKLLGRLKILTTPDHIQSDAHSDAHSGFMPERKCVFMVDVNPNRARKLTTVLSVTYNVFTFPDGGAALEAMQKTMPHLVLIDETTLSMRGHGILKTKVNDRILKFIPFIILSNGMEGPLLLGDQEGAPDCYIKRPFSTNALMEQISSSLSFSVERSWTTLPKKAQQSLKSSIDEFKKISNAIQSGQPVDIHSTKNCCRPLVECVQSDHYKDVLDGVRKHHNYTYVHSLRVATYLAMFGNALGMNTDQMQILSAGGLLHDVGKMATPQHVLNKPDKLTAEEWEIMKGHVDHSKDILSTMTEVNESIRIIAGQHHEKIDGSGYPLGLKGNQLNELARMAAIVDIFVALTDERSYKPAYSEDIAFSTLEDMGAKLDQRMVRSFREVTID